MYPSRDAFAGWMITTLSVQFSALLSAVRMGTEIVLANLVDEKSRADPLSMVNQAEIIGRTWLPRVEMNLRHDDPPLPDIIGKTTIMTDVLDFRARVREIQSSNGTKTVAVGGTGATNIYDELLHLTRKLLELLLGLVRALLDHWSTGPKS